MGTKPVGQGGYQIAIEPFLSLSTHSFNRTMPERQGARGTGSATTMTRETYDVCLRAPWGDIIYYCSTDYSVGADFATTGSIFPYELAVLATMITEGDSVIDIGANNGYLSCYLARLVGMTGHVYAIEPASQELHALLRNLQVNGHENVTCSQLLLGESAGIERLWLSSTNLGRHSLYPANATGTTGSEPVRITIADQYMDEVGVPDRVDLVKIDVEGAECSVLRGASRVLQRTQNVWVEIWPAGVQAAGDDPWEIIEILTEHGFSLTAHNIVARTSHDIDPSGPSVRLAEVMQDSPIAYMHARRHR